MKYWYSTCWPITAGGSDFEVNEPDTCEALKISCCAQEAASMRVSPGLRVCQPHVPALMARLSPGVSLVSIRDIKMLRHAGH